jgi:hypothetical protein
LTVVNERSLPLKKFVIDNPVIRLLDELRFIIGSRYDEVGWVAVGLK